MSALEARIFWGKELRDVQHVLAPHTLEALPSLKCEDGYFILKQPGREPYPMRPGTVAIVHQEELTYALRIVPPPETIKAPRTIDYVFLNWLISTAFVMSTAIFALHLYPEDIDTLDETMLERPTKFTSMLVEKPREPERVLDAIANTPATPAAAPKAKGKTTPQPRIDYRNAGALRLLDSGSMQAILGGGSVDVTNAINETRGPTHAGLGDLQARDNGGGDTNGDPQSLGIGPPRTHGRLGGDARYGDEKAKLGPRREADITLSNDPPTTSGALPPELIQQVMREQRNAFRYCYERQLQSHPGLEGAVKVQFVIGPDGRVLSASVKDATLKDADVEMCLLQRIRALQFPKPRGGGIVVVSYPFVFRSH